MATTTLGTNAGSIDRLRAWGKLLLALGPLGFILAILYFAAGATAVNAAGPTPFSAVVQTVEGPVRGVQSQGVIQFLGIPYAAPPVGDLRWRAPQPLKHWRKTMGATHYASACPQVSTLGNFALPEKPNEDCLYLNVFTTGTNRTKGRGRPVLVWIHGGANVTGNSSDYDPSRLAKGGPDGQEVVVVTFNYRLNLFGNISHPAIEDPGFKSGNFATLDQQAVLRWVQRNIARFGGDPARVVVAGQSAGSVSTGAQVLSPGSSGLISGAIFVSSPGFTYIFPTAEQARSKGMAFAAAAGCPGEGAAAADCLRKLSAARILQLAGSMTAFGPYVNLEPYVDGTVIPLQPEEAWLSGRFNKVPIMGGSTSDEYTFFTGLSEYYTGWPPKPMSAADFEEAMRPGAFCLWCKDSQIPADARAVYAPEKFGGDPMWAYQRLGTDTAKCREQHVLNRWTRWVPVYAWDFTYSDAPFYFPKMPGLKIAATHTIDLQFYFTGYHGGPLGVNLDQGSGLPRGLNTAEDHLSNQLIGAWTRFAATGNPNVAADIDWPRFSGDSNGRYLVQDIPLSTKTVRQFREEYKCDYWRGKLPIGD